MNHMCSSVAPPLPNPWAWSDICSWGKLCDATGPRSCRVHYLLYSFSATQPRRLKIKMLVRALVVPLGPRVVAEPVLRTIEEIRHSCRAMMYMDDEDDEYYEYESECFQGLAPEVLAMQVVTALSQRFPNVRWTDPLEYEDQIEVWLGITTLSP